MKHYFLINPAAGKGKLYRRLDGEIRTFCEGQGVDYEVYYTKGAGDAEDYIRRTCHKNSGELRFYACGGDGTLNEAANGAAGYPNAAVGVIPTGTGNDFVRNFTCRERFFDMGAQIGGRVAGLDLIEYNQRYATTTLNSGFDAEVVKTVLRIKRYPVVPVKAAYFIGALVQLISKPGVKMRVAIDGGEIQEKDLLLVCIGNSAYCGGGFHSGPHAGVADGELDVCFIKNVSRLTFLSLLGSYKDGTYLQRRGIDKIAEYVKCHSLDIDFGEPRSISVDGELVESDRLSVRIKPGALRFCLPAGCEAIEPLPYLP
ncbi:MAG TPA: hypothetical protein GX011_00570 [Clostridiales bacterium]|jgi:diacylglycerol kinase (ATP)|nr:hypothetical protein [Clostridiales bacterium]